MTDEEKDAILEQAASAYAARHDGTSRDAARTRARVFASRAGDRRRTMLAMAAAAVLALGLGLPTAWAWSSGALETWLGGADEPREVVAPVTRAEEERVAASTVIPESATAELPVEPMVQVDPPSLEDGLEARAEPSDEDEGPSIDPAERRTYRAAHALHFETREPAAALAAWDHYLAEYPSGRFAIEARYNRALCLVRLDRPEEARVALGAFAEGRHGEYRRREATALIEALSE